jgi:transposase
VLEEDPLSEEIIARVAALDIGKAELVCCVRVPHEGKPGRRLQEVETYSTMTRSLLAMSDHLRCLGVSRVVMEATSDYWKPVVRHAALWNRAGVKGPRDRSVVAGR